MKRVWNLIAILAVGALLMTGCSNKELDVDEFVKNEQIANELEGAPAWVMSSIGNDDTLIYGMGVAAPVKGDISFQRSIASASARDEIARTISTRTKNMLKSFKEKTGTKDNMTFDTVVSDVSKQVSFEVLSGSKQESWWISKSGNLYVLIGMPKKNISDIIKQKSNSSFKNNDALWQKFQGKQAQEELDFEIEKVMDTKVVQTH
jgi:hypothetical protein